MGLILSIFLSYVGAIEFAVFVSDIVHQVSLHQQRIEATHSSSDDLERLQENIRTTLKLARERSPNESDSVQYMQDGVRYENGYRIGNDSDGAVGLSRENQNNAKQATIEKYNRVSATERRRSDEERSSNSNSTITVVENEKWNLVDVNEQSNDIETSQLSDSMSSVYPLSTSSAPSPTESSTEAADAHFDEFSDDHLRALDGIKSRSINRNDSLRRRRALKKSNSGSSDGQRHSREEELKMFTSLEEEEEFEMIRNGDYKPIQYSNDVSAKTRRRRRSPPAGQRRSGDESDDGEARRSTESDIVNDPWGDVRPELFHDTELWRRERAMSIPEIDAEDDIRLGRSYSPVGKKHTKSMSFEAANDDEHAKACQLIATTQNQMTNEIVSAHSNLIGAFNWFKRDFLVIL